MTKKLMTCALGFIVCGPAAFAITFTGDVPTDFTSTDVQILLDDIDDVGLPSNAPGGVISGWDVDNAKFELDRTAGNLHVGLDFRGIAGDADGDGGEGTTGPWLAANRGVDRALLAGTESICVAFDFDQDGNYDAIAGVPAGTTAYSVRTYTNDDSGPSYSFGALLNNDGGHFYTPVLASPDFELTLSNLGDFEDLDAQLVCFNILVFAGSFQDDGIGEDLLFGEVCFTDDGTVEAQLDPGSMDLVKAYPNPFNPSTTLAVELAVTGHVELAVYNLNGQLVQTLVNGMMGAGQHSLTFDAAGLPSGLYLAKLSTDQGVQVTRLLLSK